MKRTIYPIVSGPYEEKIKDVARQISSLDFHRDISIGQRFEVLISPFDKSDELVTWVGQGEGIVKTLAILRGKDLIERLLYVNDKIILERQYCLGSKEYGRYSKELAKAGIICDER